MASTSSMRQLAMRFSKSPSSLLVAASATPVARTIISSNSQRASSFSTSPSNSAKPARQGPPSAVPKTKALKKNKGHQPQQDPKIVNMKKHLSLLNPNYIPPPLRMARNRHLRHWTIHRAWMLFQRKQKEDHERELMRMHQSMHAACEELRLTEGPGTREEGYLYRVAMEKKGVYGANGVPIEYARMQTETPAREAWKHDWKRPEEAKA